MPSLSLMFVDKAAGRRQHGAGLAPSLRGSNARDSWKNSHSIVRAVNREHLQAEMEIFVRMSQLSNGKTL